MAKEPDPISQADAMALIDKLRAGSRIASEAIASAYWDWLVRRMKAVAPKVHDHMHQSAASDALITLIKWPDRYDPARSPLAAYLFMLANADLKNALSAESRHHYAGRRGADRPPPRVVALSALPSEPHADEYADPARFLERREALQAALAQARPQIPAQVERRLTPIEARVLVMMRDRVRRTIEFAEVMGITHLPAKEQRDEVKKMKDRLKKRLERAGDRHEPTA